MKRKFFCQRKQIAPIAYFFLAIVLSISFSTIFPIVPREGGVSASETPVSVASEAEISRSILSMEQNWANEYAEYFGTEFVSLDMQVEEMARSLAKMDAETGNRAAIVWLMSKPEALNIAVVTPDRPPFSLNISAADRESLEAAIRNFNQAILAPRYRFSTRYKTTGKQLYDWIIAPIEKELEADAIDTLIFCNGEGLRTVPYPALFDGEQFLIEKYALANTPAYYLTELDYQPLNNARILAMGASEFADLAPLPGVEIEINTITRELWPGEALLNETFTLNNLRDRREKYPFEIVHFATHAQFKSGAPTHSFIQFFDEQIHLDRLDRLNLNHPPVELLVLSACETALGDSQAELGFAGLAVRAGVKAVLGSLWQVSDVGSVALMSAFYQELQETATKAEALQKAQIAMIRGEVRLEDGALLSSSTRVAFPTNVALERLINFSHPYYWAAYAIIGSPW